MTDSRPRANRWMAQTGTGVAGPAGQGAMAAEWLSAPMSAMRHGVTSRLVRQDAPPQEQAQTQPPAGDLRTRGWWAEADWWAGRLFTS